MGKCIFLIVFLSWQVADMSQAFSQDINIHSIKAIAGEGDDFIVDHARDNQTNLYIGGTFCSSVLNFDALQLESDHNIPSQFYQSDIFIAKYSNVGIIQWAVSGGGNYADKLTALVSDGDGNTWFTGYFGSDIFEMDTFSLEKISTTGVDMFIGRLDTEGNLAWLKNFGSENDTWCRDICMGNNGEIYAIGEFTGDSMLFDTSKVYLSGDFGFADVFVIKIDPSGKVLKVLTVEGDSEDLASLIAFRNNKVVFGINHYSSNITFGATQLDNKGMYDGVIGIADQDLIPVGALGIGGNRQDFINAVDISSYDDIIIAGSFKSDTLYIEDQEYINNTATDDIKQFDIFVAQYDGEMNLVRSYAFGQLPNDEATTVKFDSERNIILGGSMVSSSMTIGDHTISHSPGVAGHSDIFIVKIDENGNGLWSSVIYSALDDENMIIDLIADYAVDISGNYRGSILNAGTRSANNSGGDGTYEPFIAFGHITSTGINDMAEINRFRVFPNPARSVIQLMNAPADISRIQIMDLTGRVIREIKPDGSEMDVEDLNSGIYILKAITNRKDHTVLFRKD